jgi:hypothetical protein
MTHTKKKCTTPRDGPAGCNMDLASLMSDQAPDCFYIVDTTLIRAYVSRELPKWNEYVDHVSKKGSRFFVTALTRSQLGCKLPPPFHPYDEEDRDAYFLVEISMPMLFKVFKIKSYRFAHDLRWVFGCGYTLRDCQRTHFQTFSRANGIECLARGFAITANTDLVQRFLHDRIDNKKFNKVVRSATLGHLPDVRAVDLKSGKFRDYPGIVDWNFPMAINLLSAKVFANKSLYLPERHNCFFPPEPGATRSM